MRLLRGRRLVGLLTLVVLLAIAVGVSGIDVAIPDVGSGAADRTPLPGVRALAASLLLRVGAGAPPGGELAFLAIEPNGNLLVSDAGRRSVLRFDARGQLLSEWGPSLGGATLDEPAGVAVVGDSLYVVDRGTPRVFRLDATGRVGAILHLESLGTYGLNGMAADLAGNVYVADTGRNRILVLGPDGSLLRMLGHAGSDVGGFTQPMMLAFAPDGGLFVADWENSRIDHLDATYQATAAWSTGFRPFGVAVDELGRVFVPDSEHDRVQAYSAEGALLGDLGGPGSSAIDVAPRQVAVGRSGQPSLYALGADGVVRLDLENTAPPPQASSDVDVVSLGVIAVVALLVGAAVLSRRTRRLARYRLTGAAPGRPIRLDAEDRAQGQHEQPGADEDLLIAHQAKREQ